MADNILYCITEDIFFRDYKFCNFCALHCDFFTNTKVINFEISFEIDKSEICSIIQNRIHYCGRYDIRLYYIKQSDDPTREDYIMHEEFDV